MSFLTDSQEESWCNAPEDFFENLSESGDEDLQGAQALPEAPERCFVLGPPEDDYDDAMFESLDTDSEDEDEISKNLNYKAAIRLLLKWKGIDKLPEENRSNKVYIVDNSKNMKRLASGKKMRYHDGIGMFLIVPKLL